MVIPLLKYNSEKMARMIKKWEEATKKVMDENSFVDIDEGEMEAVTESACGIVVFFDDRQRAHSYLYVIDFDKETVCLNRCEDLDY